MDINVFETSTILVLFLIFGYYLDSKIKFLRDNYIPAPVIGGILFSLVLAIAKNFIDINIDYGDISTIALAVFIGSIGFRFTYHIFKTVLPKLLLYFGIVILIAVGQNIISFTIGSIFHKSLYESAILGSLGMMGDASITSGLTDLVFSSKYGQLFLDVSNATLYLGVIGVIITFKYFLKPKVNLEHSIKVPKVILSPPKFLNYLGIMIFIAAAGLIPHFIGREKIFTTVGGPLVVGMFTRWVVDKVVVYRNTEEIDNWIVNFIGNFALSILLVTVFAKADPFVFFRMDIYSIFIIVIQLIALATFAVVVVFKVFKEDTLACYIAAGTVGFSLGIPPSTMSVIQRITELEGAQPYFLFIVPPGAAWLITIVNHAILILFMMIFGG